MSCVSKKLFTFAGVKNSDLTAAHQGQETFLSQKGRTLLLGRERLVKGFFSVSIVLIIIYINLSLFTLPPRTYFCARTREEKRLITGPPPDSG